LLFLNSVAGLFCAPFLYWNSIFMRVILAAAHDTPILIGLNTLGALAGLLLIAVAALGVGGCLSALRAVLRGQNGFLPGMVFGGMRRCAKTSLLAGVLLGASHGVLRVGLVNLHALLPAGPLRCVFSVLLMVQFLVVLPLCLLAAAQSDETQRSPLRAFAQAGQLFRARSLRWFGLLAATLALPLFFFVWAQPLLTLLGFAVVVMLAPVPVLAAWQRTATAANLPQTQTRKQKPPLLFFCFCLSSLAALLYPLLVHSEMPPAATALETLRFIARQTLLEADNGTFRDLLSSSSVWPLLLAALVGSACCVLVAYACACYRFRSRQLVFAVAVLLQILPMLSNYSSLEQLLRNLHLPFSSLVLGLAWALLYILFALLLYRHFARMRPRLEANKKNYPGVRLFFYYALPRAHLHVAALIALVTLGYWNDALAPFWHMRRLGAFSVSNFVWQALTPRTRWLYGACLLAALVLLCLCLRIGGTKRHAKN
jgi:ABC-type glycerol-3-phosphate transport system permease component